MYETAFRRLSPEEPDDLEMMEEEEQEEAEEQPMRKRANSRAFSRQFDPCALVHSHPLLGQPH